MTIIQEALTLSVLWVAVTVNILIVAHIVGAHIGMIIGKLANCALGFDVVFKNSETGARHVETFVWREAWLAQEDFEMLKRYARNKALRDIEGDL